MNAKLSLIIIPRFEWNALIPTIQLLQILTEPKNEVQAYLYKACYHFMNSK